LAPGAEAIEYTWRRADPETLTSGSAAGKNITGYPMTSSKETLSPPASGSAEGFVRAQRKTLGLTGITLKTMTLMAPGALVWVFFPLQASLLGGAGDMWSGTILALGIALVTVLCYSELSRAFPNAGGRGSYFFAQMAFLDRNRPVHPGLTRAAKQAVGWAAHLYYWIYPGILTAFLTALIVSLLSQFGVQVLVPGRIVLSGLIVMLAALLAGRGISGSSLTAVVTNLLQMLALIAVCACALLFRADNPLGIVLWQYRQPADAFLPSSLAGTLFQGAFAILILAGFESSTSLAAEAVTPRRDIPRGAVLSLLLQGLFAYLLAYAAFQLALNDRLTAGGGLAGLQAVAFGGAGLAGLAVQIGDAVLSGNGFALMIVLSFTCAIVLFGLLLAAINMGVRVSFVMAHDREIPSVLGALHEDFATPYVAVWILAAVSGVIAALGAAGPEVLGGFILACNAGVFLLYALICMMTFAAFRGKPGFRRIRQGVLPAAGTVLNLGMFAAWIVLGLSRAGASRAAALWALAAVGIWGGLGVFLFLRARRPAPHGGKRSPYASEEIRLRHRQIYERRMRGESYAAIAGKFMISPQRAREIFQKYKNRPEARPPSPAENPPADIAEKGKTGVEPAEDPGEAGDS
jgi:APA family basic amino acid/polyamine antiporter